MEGARGEITTLLAQFSAGREAPSARLIALVYKDLHAIAARYMRRERTGHTLQPTALVHEAYLRLVNESEIEWQNRAHFFAVAATVMRRILLDYAREHSALKRGGAPARVELDEELMISEDRLDDLLILDESLNRLSALDPKQAQLIGLRFFAGLSVEEVADVMGISTATVKREWSHAKAWLQRDMRGKGAHAAR